MSDPRVFFAAERTLLAWIRTGLTIMGFGFVVARFGLFLSVLAQRAPSTASGAYTMHFSTGIGILLVLLGAMCMILPAIQHRRLVVSLPTEDVPRSHYATFPVTLALILGSLGILLAVYLAAG
jgi:putative membrane protein